MPVTVTHLFKGMLVLLGTAHVLMIAFGPAPSSALLQPFQPFVNQYLLQTGVLTGWKYEEAVTTDQVQATYRSASLAGGQFVAEPDVHEWPGKKDGQNVFVWIKLLMATKKHFNSTAAVESGLLPILCAKDPTVDGVQVSITEYVYTSAIALSPEVNGSLGPWYFACSKNR